MTSRLDDNELKQIEKDKHLDSLGNNLDFFYVHENLALLRLQNNVMLYVYKADNSMNYFDYWLYIQTLTQQDLYDMYLITQEINRNG